MSAMTKAELLSVLQAQYACGEAQAWVAQSTRKLAAKIWTDCKRGDWMLWIAARAGVDRKLLVSAACLCARQSLKHVKSGEDRPRLAIEAAERWVRGEATIEEVRAARNAAYFTYFTYAAYAADAADAAAAAAYAADAAAAAAAYAAAAYAAYAADAAAAAYADAADAAARKRSLARSADLVREVITAEMVIAAIRGAK
jgi:hypothetical protein